MHIHAYWHTTASQTEQRPCIGTPDAWAFLGARPLLKANKAKGKSAPKQIDRGHYYCQCNKIGTIVSDTNYAKYYKFIVEQKWVICLWQQRKLTHTVAKSEIIQARGHTANYLKEVSFIESLEEEEEIKAQKARIDAMLAANYKAFKTIEEVEGWKHQYDINHPDCRLGVASRFKFLVLNGSSCLGKTQYAKALFGLENTLVVPCQGVTVPCLKEYKRNVHRAILFDEISSSCIVGNKAIFQANNDIVLLGQSPCQDHLYRVFLYGVALIVCCNDWLDGIKEDSPAEEWLVQNSVVYQCAEPMWVE